MTLKKDEHASNPMPQPLYPYLFLSEFLIDLKTLNNQSPNVISEFKYFDDVSNSQPINKFTILL